MTAPHICSRYRAAYAAAVVGIFVADAATRAARLKTAILTRMIEETNASDDAKEPIWVASLIDKLDLIDEAKVYIYAIVGLYRTNFLRRWRGSMERQMLLDRERTTYYKASFDKSFTDFACMQCGGSLDYIDNGPRYFQWVEGLPWEPKEMPEPKATPGHNRFASIVIDAIVEGEGSDYLPYEVDIEDHTYDPEPGETRRICITLDCWVEGDALAVYFYYKWLEKLTADSPELATAAAVEDDPPPRPLYLQLLKELLAIPEGGKRKPHYAAAAKVVPLQDGTPRTSENVRRRYSDWKARPHEFSAADITLVVNELRDEGRPINKAYLAAVRRNVATV
ncbi:hypothetical protein [Lewinella sp. 4G2]|uniref:hypothetical protein n=1 Tax=Lewinella sp. 4G2 TaxID=1803372 RepID=UPI0007B46BD8|nr:hypothetical protein [Lewinella sp. 4G2]OAV44721.1 hypothetical protein A3850_009555 [Lewinella sp. 4G2]